MKVNFSKLKITSISSCVPKDSLDLLTLNNGKNIHELLKIIKTTGIDSVRITSVKKVVLIIDIPELPFMPIDCFRNPKEEICKISKTEVLKRQSELRRLIAQLKEANVSIKVFDPINFLCEDEFCSFYKNDSILYRDSDHLTLKGSDLIGKAFYKEIINKIN